MRTGPIHAEVAADYIARFPDAPTKTLARLAYRENPELWSSLEAARNSFRYARGANGEGGRPQARAPRVLQQPGDPFGKLPDPIKSFDEEWGAVQLAGPAKCLVVCDLHIPYYDKAAVVQALKHGVDRSADTVMMLGDIGDFFAESFWEKDPRKRDFAGELKAVKAFLGVVRDQFPKARIVYKLGNHEDRHLRYMRVKAPELLGVPEFEFDSILGLANFGITSVGDNRPIRLGKLNMIHGHEYRFAISNPVNPARGLYLRGKAHVLCGHFHQTSQHSEKNLEENVVSTWSVGCLCDIHPEYRPLNGWNNGFAFVEVDAAGAFHVDNLRIIDGRVY